MGREIAGVPPRNLSPSRSGEPACPLPHCTRFQRLLLIPASRELRLGCSVSGAAERSLPGRSAGAVWWTPLLLKDEKPLTC